MAQHSAQVADLCNAAWAGNLEKVKSLLKILPASAVNLPGPKGFPFFLACRNINLGTNALYCAARTDQPSAEVCLELLNLPGIDLNVQVAQHGGTAAHGIHLDPNEF